MNQQLTDPWSREEAIDFADYLFRYVATRRVVRSGRNKLPLVSKHECKTVQQGMYRQNDLPERMFWAFVGLRRAGMEAKEACWIIAERLPAAEFGKKRGRPRLRQDEPLMDEKVKSVRNRIAAYEKRALRTTTPTDLAISARRQMDRFCWVRRAGILTGSVFPEDSGARTMIWYNLARRRIYPNLASLVDLNAISGAESSCPIVPPETSANS